ncbi:hypothetical protein D187_008468 [Cystobacter fuscus DSM 2262]|uniref:Uncharacterized protein n=1 Tax=Cystobacter fuscus (strain ATCC 25194 / DSM 2262 / NBRC 100088 / M29) TaxID=1242864 RepID=S9PGS3_CYSF2|nr:hypothetical protein D187_008468 [Cystobacter fuscus DSM 2262]
MENVVDEQVPMGSFCPRFDIRHRNPQTHINSQHRQRRMHAMEGWRMAV